MRRRLLRIVIHGRIEVFELVVSEFEKDSFQVLDSGFDFFCIARVRCDELLADLV